MDRLAWSPSRRGRSARRRGRGASSAVAAPSVDARSPAEPDGRRRRPASRRPADRTPPARRRSGSPSSPSSTAWTRRSRSSTPATAAAGCSSPSRAAGSGSSATGSCSPTPFLDIGDRDHERRRARPARPRLPPRLPEDPRFFVDYTDTNGDTRSSSFTRRSPADPDRADPATETRPAHVDAAVREPQRRRARLRPGRRTCTSRSATAAAAATRRATARSSTRCSARSSGSTSTAATGDDAYAIPAGQPVRGRRRRAARDLARPGCATRGG